MTDAIHINDNPGRIAYESWVSEFSARIGDEPSWSELSESAQDAWETIAENVIENRIALPVGAVELSLRRFDSTIGYVWHDAAGAELSDIVLASVRRALGGGGR
jgi:hypothetical protein